MSAVSRGNHRPPENHPRGSKRWNAVCSPSGCFCAPQQRTGRRRVSRSRFSLNRRRVQKDGKLSLESCSSLRLLYLPRFPFAQGSHFVPRRTCPDCLFPSSFSRPSARCAGLILSFSTDSRSGSIDFACVRGQGARYFRPSRRPRETQFLGACSAPAWSTLAARRYLGSFTPNVETESWHNFRRRRWRAQLTPFHASATIPTALSILRLALPCLALPCLSPQRLVPRRVTSSSRPDSVRRDRFLPFLCPLQSVAAAGRAYSFVVDIVASRF